VYTVLRNLSFKTLLGYLFPGQKLVWKPHIFAEKNLIELKSGPAVNDNSFSRDLFKLLDLGLIRLIISEHVFVGESSNS